MKITETFEFTRLEGQYYNFDPGQDKYRSVIETQRTARPTTHEEYAILSCGNCPECGAVLSGDNGKFCVPDQTWWEFENGMNFPEKSKQ